MWTAHTTARTHMRAKGSELDQAIQRDLTQKSLQNQEMLHCNMVLLKIITKKKKKITPLIIFWILLKFKNSLSRAAPTSLTHEPRERQFLFIHRF